jgi:type I restriction enzyme S subunit
MKYKTYALGELVQIKYGKNQKKVLSEEGTIPIYGTGGLMGYATETLYDKPSVLIGRKGTIGKVRYVDHPFWTVDTLFYTIVNTELVLPKYLFYLMSQMDLNAYNEGTTIPSLRTDTLNRLEFDIPSIEEQKEVLSYLEPIDDKIQLNTEINKNLLEQAQAIYTKRFIIDADSLWPEGKLSDLIEVCYGKDHKKLHDGDIPVYGSGGIMRHVDRALYEQESVLVPRKGTLNNVMYVDEPFWSVDTMFFTKMKRQNVAKFVFHFLKGKDLASMNAGSAVPSMTTKILNAIPLQIPDDQTLSTFEAQVSPFYQAASYKNKESENLAAIRDSLLPKLMSGEIDVSDIDL